jgi:hypothetical protein
MTDRKPFLLRLQPGTMSALRAWAADDLRSLNGQIEYLLRRALRDAGRLSPQSPATAAAPPQGHADASPQRTPAAHDRRRTRASSDRKKAARVRG